MEYQLALKMEESSHMLKQCMIPLIRGIKKSQSSQKQKVEFYRWGLGGQVVGMGSYCLIGTEFQFCEMKRILEMDKGDGHTTI